MHPLEEVSCVSPAEPSAALLERRRSDRRGGLRPESVWDDARQPVLDAVIELQDRRRSAARALAAGRDVPGAEICAVAAQAGAWMMRESWTWRHLLSTRPRTTGGQLRESMPNNAALLENGLEMISVFDGDGTDDAACEILNAAESGVYYYGYAPVQVRIVDRNRVYLHGPTLPAGETVMCLSDRRSVAAAHRYWAAVGDTTVRCDQLESPIGRLTERQQQVLNLLRADLDDEAVAHSLEVSVRTVRYDVAAALEVMGVRSRFAAGFAYAEALRHRR